MADSSIGNAEIIDNSLSLQPHVTLITSGETSSPLVDGSYRNRVQQIGREIYPVDTVSRLVTDRFNPTMIGFEHPPTLQGLSLVKQQFTHLKDQSTAPLKVAQEIRYKELGYIQSFLKAEKVYLETGSLNGRQPSTSPESHRERLRRHYTENLTLWLLENGFNVVSIESPDVDKWIEEDRQYFPLEETFSGEREPVERHALTAIRRDIHGLQVLDKERPDIVSVGVTHALKYDLLLNKDGRNSHYFVEPGTLNFNRLLSMWDQVHTVYKNKQLPITTTPSSVFMSDGE